MKTVARHATPVTRPSGSIAWRVSLAVLVALTGVGVMALAIPTTSQASVADAVQVVAVNLGPDAGVGGLESRTAVRDKDGKVTTSTTPLDANRDAADLPVKVSVAYWLGDKTGTNLSDIAGQSGRVTIKVTVQDLTAKAQEVGYDFDGSRYRQNALVGVPLTVVMATNLGQPDNATIVVDPQAASAADSEWVTNGTVGRNKQNDWTVQWAALLASPLLPSTATFSLTVDTADFAPPAFDLVVQPGFHLDPSVQGLLTTTLSPDGDMSKLEESAVKLVLDVNTQADQARGFVESVHQALSKDVEQMGAETYRELQQSSQRILGQLADTERQLEETKTSVSQKIGDSRTQLTTALTAMIDDIKNNVLGSPPVDTDFTEDTFTGCSIELPGYAKPADHQTLADAIGLVDRQLTTIREAFAADPEANNCRNQMALRIKASLGVGATCEPGAAEASQNVICGIDQAKNRLDVTSDGLTAAIKTAVDRVVNDTEATGLAGQVAALDDNLARLTTDVAALRQQTGQQGAAGATVLTSINTTAGDLTTTLADVKKTIKDLESAAAGLTTTTLEADRATLATGVTTELGWLKSIAADTTDAEFLKQAKATVAAMAPAINQVRPAPAPVCVDAAAAAKATTGAALVALLVPAPAKCDATQQTLVKALAADLTRFQGLLSTVNGLASQPVTPPAGAAAGATHEQTMTTKLANLKQGLADLDAQLKATLAAFKAAITPLLDQLTTDATAITRASATPDDLNTLLLRFDAVLAQDAAGARTTLAGVRSGTVKPLPAGTAPSDPACVAALDAPEPTLAFDRVISQANKLTCRSASWQTSVPSLFADFKSNLTQAQSSLDNAKQQTADAANSAAKEVGSASDKLIGALGNPTDQEQTLVVPDYARITAARESAGQQGAATVDGFKRSSAEIVDALSQQLGAAVTDSTAARETLGSDFETLMNNLGNPAVDSRTGMLGKLRDIASQVGDTSGVLTALVRSSTTYGNDRVTDLRSLNFKAAELSAAQQRLAELRPFAGAPDVPTVATAFAFHLATP